MRERFSPVDVADRAALRFVVVPPLRARYDAAGMRATIDRLAAEFSGRVDRAAVAGTVSHCRTMLAGQGCLTCALPELVERLARTELAEQMADTPRPGATAPYPDPGPRPGLPAPTPKTVGRATEAARRVASRRTAEGSDRALVGGSRQ